MDVHSWMNLQGGPRAKISWGPLLSPSHPTLSVLPLIWLKPNNPIRASNMPSHKKEDFHLGEQFFIHLTHIKVSVNSFYQGKPPKCKVTQITCFYLHNQRKQSKKTIQSGNIVCTSAHKYQSIQWMRLKTYRISIMFHRDYCGCTLPLE